MTKKRPDDPGLIEAEDLGRWTTAKVRIVKDREAVSDVFAQTIADCITANNRKERNSTFIMPVGPTGQYRKLAALINREKLDVSRLYFFNMDEYVGPDGRNVPPDHPFSFARFVKEEFLDLVDRKRGLRKNNFHVPDAQNVLALGRAIKQAGGVDICFAGIGLDGHLAFNEPPEPYESWTDERFARAPVRVIKLAPVTKATNAIFGTGGDLKMVPDFAVTIGMEEILASRQIQVFLDWHWQRRVVREALYGPVTRFCPATYLQTHRNVVYTMAECVAERHVLKPE